MRPKGTPPPGKSLESMRRVTALVIFSAFASMSTGCAEYLADQDTADFNQHITASPQTPATNGVANTKISDTEQSRAICVEGSVAECEAACDSGRLAMCITLAQELHSGARVTADPVQADRVLARACNGGRLDACLQRGIWIETADPDEAAELFMRGCQAERTDSITTTMSCGLWMTLLDDHVYEPNDGDEYAGLARICALEENGALIPGSTITDGSMSTHYIGGACGRLKDLGMAVGSVSRRDLPKTQTANVVAVNPYAPKW